jgi:hypothetical protein
MTMPPIRPWRFRLETPCLVEPEDVRDDGSLGCRWCPASLGDVHAPRCVTPEKLAVLEVVVRLVVPQPRIDTPAEIEHFYATHWDGDWDLLYALGESLTNLFESPDPPPGLRVPYRPVATAVRYVRDAGPAAEAAALATRRSDESDDAIR